MIDFKENKKFVELRQKFYKETGTFALINKRGYLKWLEENLVKNLVLSGVSQQRELFADQDNRDFILWQRDRDITRLENGKYKWREFEYDRQFFLEKYIEDRNKANCG